MGPASSYRLLHSLFLPPLPCPSALRRTARGASNCAPIRGGSPPCRRSWSPGYLPSPRHVGILSLRSGFTGFSVSESDRSGFGVVRNSRSDHGVVGSSWTKASGAKSVDSPARRSPPSKGARKRRILPEFAFMGAFCALSSLHLLPRRRKHIAMATALAGF